MVSKSKAAHIGSSLSAADLLAVLYGKVLRLNPKKPSWPQRDRFIMSKGHGAAAYYAALAECGFFSTKLLETYSQDGTKLAGHVTSSGIPGIEASTGSLGHGLSMACGMALAAKHDGKAYRTFALLSDGELDEGSVWESVLFAAHHKLDNLTAIVDYNKIQSFGTVKEILNLEPLVEKWKAFGWSFFEINGHDIKQIEDTLGSVPLEIGKPSVIIAHTIKGKGVSFMENKLECHYQSPSEKQLKQALSELGAPS